MMSFENLAKDPTYVCIWKIYMIILDYAYYVCNLVDFFDIFSFVTGLELLHNVDDKKFVRLVDRMMKDFDPNRTSSFTEHELKSMEKSLKLNSDQCQCLVNCLNRLLKQVNFSSQPGLD